MNKNILNIVVEGKLALEFNKKYNYISVSEKELSESEVYLGEFLQINYQNPEEILKALEIIKMEFGKIDKINIIFNNQKLNMLSYQFDYEFLKDLYLHKTSTLIYFISLLIPFYNDKIEIDILASKFNYYQIHNINWLNSITNFLKSLKKDLEAKIIINLINCK